MKFGVELPFSRD